MTSRNRTRHTAPCKSVVLSALTVSLAAAGLFVLPADAENALRTWVRDGLSPGQRVVRTTNQRIDAIKAIVAAARQQQQKQAATATEIERWRIRVRQLTIQNAALQEELNDRTTRGASPYQAVTGDPLLVPQLLEANVIGKELGQQLRAGLVLDKGANEDVHEADWILLGDGLNIDQGEDSGLELGLPVYAGQCVVGKVNRLGRWTSTVQLVTDTEFQALVQLVRSNSDSTTIAAQGMLVGGGEELCRVKYVSSTEAVAIGDEVYTAERSGLLPSPMYYGKVVKAELKPGSPHWEIWVEPALTHHQPRTVQVLRMRPNPARMLAN